jgi:hypothetical protein
MAVKFARPLETARETASPVGYAPRQRTCEGAWSRRTSMPKKSLSLISTCRDRPSSFVAFVSICGLSDLTSPTANHTAPATAPFVALHHVGATNRERLPPALTIPEQARFSAAFECRGSLAQGRVSAMCRVPLLRHRVRSGTWLVRVFEDE